MQFPFLLHPLFMGLGTLLGLIAFYYGLLRIQDKRAKRAPRFLWKRHQHLGMGAVACWLIGAVAIVLLRIPTHGLAPATHPHALRGFAALLAALILGWSGIRLSRGKLPVAKRERLAIVHACAGALALLLALYQILVRLI